MIPNHSLNFQIFFTCVTTLIDYEIMFNNNILLNTSGIIYNSS